MAYEMKPGQGSLFRNDKKTTDLHPTLKGKVMLPNGELRWLSAWSKKTASGDAWISLSLGDVVAGSGSPAPRLDSHSAAKGNGFAPLVDDDSDIPF